MENPLPPVDHLKAANESLKGLIGGYVMELLVLQAQVAQLQDENAALRAALQPAEPAPSS